MPGRLPWATMIAAVAHRVYFSIHSTNSAFGSKPHFWKCVAVCYCKRIPSKFQREGFCLYNQFRVLSYLMSSIRITTLSANPSLCSSALAQLLPCKRCLQLPAPPSITLPRAGGRCICNVTLCSLKPTVSLQISV